MKIVMDFRKYDGVIGGVEKGVIEIVNYLCRHDHSVVLLGKEFRINQIKSLFLDLGNLELISLSVKSHVMSRQNSRLDATTIQEIALEEGADIIHFPYNWSFPKNKKIPSILTIHDVIPFTFREAMGLYQNLFLYRHGIKKACQLNDFIATVSEFSKQEIALKTGTSLDKIRVIPNGLRLHPPYLPEREKALKNKYDLLSGFILNVGGIHERKNIPRLILAFAWFKEKSGYKGKLLITGSVSGAPYQIKMKKRCDMVLRKAGIGEDVMFTGFISNEDLDSLFRIADFFIYPSLCEGFGIPILEAMQAGTPVITSNVSAMPEVAKGAALLIDPYDINSIVEGMVKLYRDKALCGELKKRGQKRAKEYSWDRTAQMYLELYGSVVNKLF